MARRSKHTDRRITNDSPEIDEGAGYLGYRDALNLVYANVHPVGTEKLSLDFCTGRIVAEDLVALVDNPSTDISLKDGFAIKSEDVIQVSAQHPVRLPVIGSVFAGTVFPGEVSRGSAVKVCSGSPIPRGADAVIVEEFCQELASEVIIKASAEPGRNILRAGEEIKAGAIVIEKGKSLLPGYLGLAAVGGISHATVYRRPKVAVIAIEMRWLLRVGSSMRGNSMPAIWLRPVHG
jgi:molybdopterin molybdotransferase